MEYMIEPRLLVEMKGYSDRSFDALCRLCGGDGFLEYHITYVILWFGLNKVMSVIKLLFYEYDFPSVCFTKRMVSAWYFFYI